MNLSALKKMIVQIGVFMVSIIHLQIHMNKENSFEKKDSLTGYLDTINHPMPITLMMKRLILYHQSRSGRTQQLRKIDLKLLSVKFMAKLVTKTILIKILKRAS